MARMKLNDTSFCLFAWHNFWKKYLENWATALNLNIPANVNFVADTWGEIRHRKKTIIRQ